MSKTPQFSNLKRNWGSDIDSLKIVHIDMDSFYASIEISRHPEAKNKPVVVGGTNLSGVLRGVVSSANYEARQWGIYAGQPMAQARRFCPNLVNFPVDMPFYEEISAKAIEIFRKFTPKIEVCSIDEVFLDLSGSKLLFGPVFQTVAKIRQQIFSELGVVCSAGVAHNKLVAKLAVNQAKPNGQIYVCQDAAQKFVQSLPVKSLWGVGPATAQKLKRYGITSVKQLVQLNEDKLKFIFKEKIGEKLYYFARGIDKSEIVVADEPKSIGNQETLYCETVNQTEILQHLMKMTEKSVNRLCQAGYFASRVFLYIKYSDFSTNCVSRTLPDPVCDTQTIYNIAKELYSSIYNGKKVRLIGVSLAKLVDISHVGKQKSFSLFEYGIEKKERLQKAINLLNKRYDKQVVRYM
ncbi:MAG: DNA polymerase IV [Bifidobacteriaceae bacterium]|jgi:DNA polymerase-4|nr:DNA polymerase IV [Bifidobacteriaceae bacterium]